MSDAPPLLDRVDGDDRNVRLARLAARVRWLDRYRRIVAIIAAGIIAPLTITRVATALGAEWPQVYGSLLSVLLGVLVWWVIEVALIYATALWETEHDGLVRDRGLPRAILHKPRS